MNIETVTTSVNQVWRYSSWIKYITVYYNHKVWKLSF